MQENPNKIRFNSFKNLTHENIWRVRRVDKLIKMYLYAYGLKQLFNQRDSLNYKHLITSDVGCWAVSSNKYKCYKNSRLLVCRGMTVGWHTSGSRPTELDINCMNTSNIPQIAKQLFSATALSFIADKASLTTLTINCCKIALNYSFRVKLLFISNGDQFM